MSGSDTALFNQVYKNIERPYANIDLSKVQSWDLVMSIMEHQAMEARRQIIGKYHAQSEQLTPQTVMNFEYQTTPYNYSQNGSNSTEESDASSECSEEMMSNTATSSDVSQHDSDIEIDVDSIEEESEEYFAPTHDNIPITVLQLETKLREKERKQSAT